MIKLISKCMVFCLVFIGFIQLNEAFAQQGGNSPLAQLARDFQTTMLDCPEKLWPDYSWKDTNVFLIRTSQNKAFKFSDQSPQLTEIDLGGLPSNALTSLYSFFQFNNNSALSINLDIFDGFGQPQITLFALAVHEFFHYHGQRYWSPSGASRTTTYPLSAKPRLYRRMMFDNLKTYFLSNGVQKEALGKASFWFQKWKTEYPAEAISTTDGTEGTARYMDILANTLVRTGCQVSDSELYDQTKNGLFEQLGFSVVGNRFALDSEGYDIGGLASLILRLIHKEQNWYYGVKLKITPVESLLGVVTPVSDEIPDSVDRSFRENEQLQNHQLGALVDQDIANYKNPEFIRVLLASQALTSNYSPFAFLNTAEVQGTLIPMSTDLSFVLGQTSLQSKKLAVSINPKGDPCQGQGGWMFLVNRSDTSLAGQVMSVTAPRLQGQAVGETKIDATGMTWFCTAPQ